MLSADSISLHLRWTRLCDKKCNSNHQMFSASGHETMMTAKQTGMKLYHVMEILYSNHGGRGEGYVGTGVKLYMKLQGPSINGCHLISDRNI